MTGASINSTFWAKATSPHQEFIVRFESAAPDDRPEIMPASIEQQRIFEEARHTNQWIKVEQPYRQKKKIAKKVEAVPRGPKGPAGGWPTKHKPPVGGFTDRTLYSDPERAKNITNFHEVYWYDPRPKNGDDRCNYCGVLVARDHEQKGRGLRGLVQVMGPSVGTPYCRSCLAQLVMDTTQYVRVLDLTNLEYGYAKEVDVNVKWLSSASRLEVMEFNHTPIREADNFLKRPRILGKLTQGLRKFIGK